MAESSKPKTTKKAEAADDAAAAKKEAAVKAETGESTRKPGTTLDTLRPAKGSRRPKLRVGRGRGSGAGKTSNRGHNGEGQRSGNSRKKGFEGGQMPGYRKVPKVDGFRVVNARKWLEINVGDLERYLLKDDTELTYAMLQERGFLRRGMDGIRLLGNGELKRKVTLHAHHATAGAREKIEAAGGSVVLVQPAVKAAAN